MIKSDFSSVNKLETVSLSEAERVKLLDRMELKYVFTLDKLNKIFNSLHKEYYILSTCQTAYGRYENYYFDTENFNLYLDHHNGKLNRFKVRLRHYIETNNFFFEVKMKTNKGRTIKSRVEIPSFDRSLDYTKKVITKESIELLKPTSYTFEMLNQCLQINYSRITLINKHCAERITLDIDLTYISSNMVKKFDQLVVAEVKQPRLSTSPFTLLMHSMHIHPLSVSKYCLGIASLYTSVKINNFKRKLLYVNKLCNITHNQGDDDRTFNDDVNSNSRICGNS